jgi:hypothetical protein
MSIMFNAAFKPRYNSVIPVEETLNTVATITNDDVFTGGFNPTTGAIFSDTNYRRTDYIPVSTKEIKLTNPVVFNYIACFDENKVFIDRVYSLRKASETIPLPQGTAFIGWTVENATTDPKTYNITVQEILNGATYPAPISDADLRAHILSNIQPLSTNVISTNSYTGTDREKIQKAIDAAYNQGGGRVNIEGQTTFLIDAAVILKSNVHVVIKTGVKVKLANSVFDNAFRVAGIVPDTNNPNGVVSELNETTNIKLLGEGTATIEGADVLYVGYNWKKDLNEEFVGDVFGWRNVMVLLSGCRNYEVGGFKLQLNHCWTISQEFATNGYLHDIEFNNTRKNGDGIDLRYGCKEILIEDLSGHTEDDAIAMSCLNGESNAFYDDDPAIKYLYPMETVGYGYKSNLYSWTERVVINRVNVNGTANVIRFLTNFDRIKNVIITDVSDKDNTSGKMNVVTLGSGYAIGGGNGYMPGNINNLTINNVTSYNAQIGVNITQGIADSTIDTIGQYRSDGSTHFLDGASTNTTVTNAQML